MGTVLAHPAFRRADRPRRRLTLVGGASSDPHTVRVAIAGGSTLIRAAFRALLEAHADVAVAGDAGAEEAVEVARATRPDVVLMCLDALGEDPTDAIAQIVAAPRVPAVQVIVLSPVDGDNHVFAALRAGASGFLPLDTDPAELIRAVRIVAGGDAFLSPEVTCSLIAGLAAQPEAAETCSEELDELTAREREVMALAATGLTNAEIGDRLVVSPATAKTHVSRAMMKLRARDRSQLVALAYRTGLVHPRRSPAPRAALALV